MVTNRKAYKVNFVFFIRKMAKNHYDARLKDMIPGNNGDNAVVLNHEFDLWEEYIVESLSDRSNWNCDREYSLGYASKLLKSCENHIHDFSKPIKTPDVISLTHPLYMHSIHMHEMPSLKSAKKQANQFLDTLLDFLTLCSECDNVSVVLQDTLHLYAASGSLLLERGLVDHAIITSYDAGDPINTEDLELFDGKRIFVGGGYNDRCLESSIDALRLEVPDVDLWGIKDLVLNSPQDNTNLFPDSTTGIASHKTISLELAKKMIGIGKT